MESTPRKLEDWELSQKRIRGSIESSQCYTWLGEGLTALQGKKFKDYDRELFPDAYDRLKAFIGHKDEEGFGVAPFENFVLFGSIGTGKTHLMCATLNALCRAWVPCKFMTGQGLFDAITRCIGDHKSYQHLLDDACNVKVLGIDDIDKVHIPASTRGSEENFQVKTFFAILNKRNMKKLPTLITTNAMDITPYVGGPGFSRLKEHGNFIQMEGKDYRETMIQW